MYHNNNVLFPLINSQNFCKRHNLQKVGTVNKKQIQNNNKQEAKTKQNQ